MRYLDLTLPSAAENIALDEALLEEAEASAFPLETLRLWEPPQPMVVVGRSSRLEEEVQLDVCRADGVPVLRRASGGATIVTGPGCLMYAVVLSYEKRPDLRPLDHTHRFVLAVIATALNPLRGGVHCAGTSDLVIDEEQKTESCAEAKGCGSAFLRKKFSGNSVRCRRGHFLYHGTLLYDFPLETVSRLLKEPPRMPDYRNRRSHDGFVMNLGIPAASIRESMQQAWDAVEPCTAWPRDLTLKLVTEKYSQPSWNACF